MQETRGSWGSSPLASVLSLILGNGPRPPFLMSFPLLFLANSFKTQLKSSLLPEAFSLKQKKYLFLLGVPRTLDIVRLSCQVATLYCDGIVK